MGIQLSWIIVRDSPYIFNIWREIANVVFRATQDITLGNKSIVKGQPVFYLDTAKTSTIEGAATTVYAQGGRGNTRLIAWEG